MRFLISNSVVVLTMLAILSSETRAQYGYSSQMNGLSATVTEKVSIKPEKLRLTMWIKAQGMDAKSAMLALTEHKDRVKNELEAMKADKESIRFSSSQVSEGEGDANSNRRAMQMQMQMQSRMKGGKGKSTPKPMPTIVTAKCALKADWPLPVKEGDVLALLPATLKEQISSRDLAGEKNKAKLSDKDLEQLEELEAMMQESFSYSDSGESTGPKIQFIAEVPEDVTKKAIQTAFKKAVKEVEMLSAATGVKLAKLSGMTSSSSENHLANIYMNGGYGNPREMPSSLLDSESKITSHANADELSITVSVSVVYNIE